MLVGCSAVWHCTDLYIARYVLDLDSFYLAQTSYLAYQPLISLGLTRTRGGMRLIQNCTVRLVRVSLSRSGRWAGRAETGSPCFDMPSYDKQSHLIARDKLFCLCRPRKERAALPSRNAMALVRYDGTVPGSYRVRTSFSIHRSAWRKM